MWNKMQVSEPSPTTKLKDETYKNIEQVFGLAQFERFYDRVEPQWRDALIDSYAYEANERIKDPINGITKFCKHIVVPGVKSLTLNGDRMITQDLLFFNCIACNFSWDYFLGDILNLSAADFEKFDTVIISCCSEIKRRKVNSRCRQLTDPIAFHSVQCRGSLAEIFVDLKSHTVYERLFGQDLKSIMHFCSFEKAIAVPWQTLTEGVSEIFLAMRVDENFEATHRRKVRKLSATDFQHLKSFKDVLCDKQQFNHNHISSATLEKCYDFLQRIESQDD
ncbi:SUMO-activating enzyme subunit 1B-1-like [Capsicum annuum]|uniref:SUMO-activating enzyme subunit 1B-1-like n=1 Tax=Capsicum annuum TaxID=4072 RepID=UPI001FB0E51D|nr:SUMO-activating enzyme subunit 1B-1-like [Capsicum annuum]